jgi:hypothetical protein
VLASDRKLTILKLHPYDAAKTLCEKNYGLHMMMIYPRLDILRQFYCAYVKKEIKDHNGIVIIAPYYETTKSVRSNLSQPPYLVDAAKYEGDGSLIIMDATKLYSTSNAAVEYITNIAKEAKNLGKKGVTVIGDMGIFYTREQPNAITDYEISFLPKEFSVDRKGFCLYDEKILSDCLLTNPWVI